MQTGMFLNSMICCFIFIFSYLTSLTIWRHRKNQADNALAIFWFWVSSTWLLVAISLLLYKYGYYGYDIFVNQYPLQITIHLQVIAGIFYVINRATNNKIVAWSSVVIFSLISIISLAYNFLPGSVIYQGSSFFSVEYSLNQITWNLFQAMFACIIVGLIFDILRNCYFWFRKKELYQSKYLIVNLASLAYATIGYFDQQGDLYVWVSLLLRSAIIFTAGVAYLAYNEQEV